MLAQGTLDSDGSSTGTQNVFSGNPDIDALLSWDVEPSYRWGLPGEAVTLTYSFVEAGWEAPVDYDTGGAEGALLVSEAMREAVRDVALAISQVVPITFVEVEDAPLDTPNHLRFGHASTLNSDGTAGFSIGGYVYHYGPDDEWTLRLSREHGDVWIDASQTEFAPGSAGRSVIAHELLHSLGLDHPHEGPTLDAALDNERYTIMSYETVVFRDADGEVRYVDAPRSLDIQALQWIYGANLSTGAGDDVYAFTGDELRSIWDAGGVDTFSAAGAPADAGVLIDLRPGALSSFPDAKRMAGGVSIAPGVEIENAVGSAGDDVLIGNALANRLEGGGGFDVFEPMGGADRVVLSAEGGEVRGALADLDGDRIEGFGIGSRILVLDDDPAGLSAIVEEDGLAIQLRTAVDQVAARIELDAATLQAALETKITSQGLRLTIVDIAPQPADDLAGIHEGGRVAGDVLDNDVDPNGDPLTVVQVEGVAPGAKIAGDWGWLKLGADGEWTYMADAARALDPGQTAVDSFDYTVENLSGARAAATLEILVEGRLNVASGTRKNDRLDGDDAADFLDGGKGNDKLFGRGGDDELVGGRGRDKYVPGQGADLLHFAKRDGKDKVAGFEDGIDLIAFGKGADSFEDLDIRQKGKHAVIDYGAHGDEIKLLKIDADALDALDFMFA